MKFSNINIDTSRITGLILAGGQGRRVQDQDKGLLDFRGKKLIEYAIDILKPQTMEILISANRNLDHYARYGYTVIKDEIAGFHGPLFGILAALKHIHTDYLLTIPCDSPFLPDTLAQRMTNTLQIHDVPASCAYDGERIHPVVNLLHRSLADHLQHYLDRGERKLQTWLEQAGYRQTDFSDVSSCFANLNSMDEFRQISPQLEAGKHE